VKPLPVLALLLAACGAPDRWSVTGARSWGEIDNFKGTGLDTGGDSLEIGVSGPLGFQREPVRRCGPITPYPATSEPEEASLAPARSQGPLEGSPWAVLLALLGGAGLSEGGRYGAKKVKERRRRKSGGF
jgi:hypothetical protein